MKGKIIALMVFGIMVTVLAFSAYADSSVKLVVDGKQIFSEVSPFIRDGRTMVPLRVISEALGAEVFWNEEARTVVIETKKQDTGMKNTGAGPASEPGQISEPPVENDLTRDRLYLSELKPLDETTGRVFNKNWGDNPDAPRGVFSIGGEKYFDGIGMRNYPDSMGSVVVSFNINGAYKKLTATIGASDIGTSPNSGKTYLQIYGDDKLLYKSQGLRSTDEAKSIDVNIDGVKVLRLVSFAEKGVGVNDAVWGDIMLHKKF